MIIKNITDFAMKKSGILEVLESPEDAYYCYHNSENVQYPYELIFRGEQIQKLQKITIPDLYIGCINKGTITGKCTVVTSRNDIVKESLPPWIDVEKNENNYSYIEKFGKLKKTTSGFELTSSETVHVEGLVVVISSCTDRAFSHFLFESLAKLHVLNSKVILEDPKIKWLVNDDILDYQLGMILGLGISPHNIIKKKFNQNVIADRIILVESPAHNNLWATKESLLFIRRVFKSFSYWGVSMPSSTDDKIYIDRKDDLPRNREIVNEGNLFKISRKKKFINLTLGNLPVTQKFLALTHAEYLIGQYGGGLQIAFLSSKLKSCIVLQSPYFYRGFIDYLGNIFGFKVLNIVGEKDNVSIEGLNITEKQNLPFRIIEDDFEMSFKLLGLN